MVAGLLTRCMFGVWLQDKVSSSDMKYACEELIKKIKHWSAAYNGKASVCLRSRMTGAEEDVLLQYNEDLSRRSYLVGRVMCLLACHCCHRCVCYKNTHAGQKMSMRLEQEAAQSESRTTV